MAKQDSKYHIEELEKIGFQYLYDADRHNGRIPHIKAVYAFVEFDLINKESEIIYIGKSNNLSQRLAPYHKIDNVETTNYIFRYYLQSESIDELEKEMIKKYSPKYNIQHNRKVKRVYICL